MFVAARSASTTVHTTTQNSSISVFSVFGWSYSPTILGVNVPWVYTYLNPYALPRLSGGRVNGELGIEVSLGGWFITNPVDGLRYLIPEIRFLDVLFPGFLDRAADWVANLPVIGPMLNMQFNPEITIDLEWAWGGVQLWTSGALPPGRLPPAEEAARVAEADHALAAQMANARRLLANPQATTDQLRRAAEQLDAAELELGGAALPRLEDIAKAGSRSQAIDRLLSDALRHEEEALDLLDELRERLEPPDDASQH